MHHATPAAVASHRHHTSGPRNPFCGGTVGIRSRAQATADGLLFDLSPIARELGLQLPVYITRAAWSDACAWCPADDRRQRPQDLGIRVRNVLESLTTAVRGARGSIVEFAHDRIPRDGFSRRPERVTLVAECAGRDCPTITISLRHELVGC